MNQLFIPKQSEHRKGIKRITTNSSSRFVSVTMRQELTDSLSSRIIYFG